VGRMSDQSSDEKNLEQNAIAASERVIVRSVIVLSAVAWAAAAYKLYAFAEYDAATASVISAAYSASAFAVWRLQFALTRPNGGVILYVGMFAGIQRVESAENATAALLAGIVGGLMFVLVLAIVFPRNPRRETTTNAESDRKALDENGDRDDRFWGDRW
jgi:hypothetical protein